MEPGLQLDKYRIEEKIGVGGMADVYRAVDTSLDRVVALKVLPPEFARDEERSRRFDKEVRASAGLTHPHIVTLYDVGHAEGYHFYTMDYIPGGDLKDRIKKGLSPAEALRIMKEICSALAHAHSKGFIHRDIKPENILFREDGTAVLTDFGIARAIGSGTRMTKTGMSIGTPHYMSPEQARGIELDHRSDLYSLGILFYEMLTGQVPYDATETFAVGLKHINDPIPELPPQFRKYQPIIDNLLAKDPGDRYTNGATLLRVLDDVQTGRKISRPVHATKLMKSVPSSSKTSGLKWALGGGVLALLLGIVVYVVLQQVNTPRYIAGEGGSGGSSISNRVPSTANTKPSMQAPVPEKKVKQKNTALLSVNSRPEGAIVYINDKNIGTTPLKKELYPGRYSLTVTAIKGGYAEVKNEITLTVGQELQRYFVLEKSKGSLNIVSIPAGSEIWLNNKKIKNTTPTTIHDLEAGTYTVRLHKDKFYDSEKKVEINPGQNAWMEFNLSGGNLVKFDGKWITPEKAEERRKAAMGRLFVDPIPRDATVKILNIKPRFESGMYLDPGSYHIEVRKAGYETKNQWVDLAKGQEQHHLITLDKEKSQNKSPFGKIWTDPITGMEFVFVKGGCFQMGDTLSEGTRDEKPVHEVCVDDFYIGKHEVTQGQWQQIMGNNPSSFKKGANYPVEQVSWFDVQEFIRELNQHGNKSVRLPTEAEWEYGCRSGDQHEKYCGNIISVSGYGPGVSTHPVGESKPNDFGLYDMSGNVWEWCSDLYDNEYYENSPRANPKGPSSGSNRVSRGGGWFSMFSGVRASARSEFPSSFRGNAQGFRLVLDVQSDSPLNESTSSEQNHLNIFKKESWKEKSIKKIEIAKSKVDYVLLGSVSKIYEKMGFVVFKNKTGRNVDKGELVFVKNSQGKYVEFAVESISGSMISAIPDRKYQLKEIATGNEVYTYN